MVQLNDSGLTLLDSQISEFSVLSLGTGDTFSDLTILEGDALGACARDVGILDEDGGGSASCLPHIWDIPGTIPL